MRDPIDSLTHLDPGDLVEQPAAAEIRRRGDARRRRRTATIAVGAVVAAAALIIPAALINGPDTPIDPATSDTATAEPTEDPTGDQSDGPTPAVVTDIPEDFPLDRYLPTGPDFQQLDPHEGDDGIEICGEWIWPAGATEVLGAMVVGPEQSETRWLGAFGDPALAEAVLENARTVLAGCDTTGANDSLAVISLEGDSGFDGVTFAVVEAGGQPGGEIVQLMRVGSAVLVSSSGGEFTAESAQAGADELTEQSVDLATDMCVFTQAGC